MTREERNRVADQILAGYEDVGAIVVSDDQSLYRLLNTLECSTAEPKIGEYLCSFLTV
jgi:hypothetical protein